MSDIINVRGKCRCPHPYRWAGQVGCWLKKGHKGPHSYWIYSWKRRKNDARETRSFVAEVREQKRWERKWMKERLEQIKRGYF